MATDTPLQNPVVVPLFKCKLPPALLDGIDEKERYLYESNDEIKQAVAWMANLSAATANRVEQVHQQARLTNGGLTQAKTDIVELKEALKETVPVVRAYKWGSQAAKSRVFWILLGICLFVVFPWLLTHIPDPILILKAAMTALFGL